MGNDHPAETLTKYVACHAKVIHNRCGSELVDSICGLSARIDRTLKPNFINYFHVLECQHVVISF